MKKVILKTSNTTNLTGLVLILMNKDGYKKYTRTAAQGSGDDVHVMFNPKTRFQIEFCIKTNSQTNQNYVNWARVSGPEEVVDRFTEACKYQSTNQVFTAKL